MTTVSPQPLSQVAKAARCLLAALLAFALGLPALAPPEARAANDPVPACALTWEDLKPHLEAGLGTPYLFGGATPAGWDCSGFAAWAFNVHADTGYTHLTTTFERELAARGSFVMEGAASDLCDERMEPGDIIFFYSEGVATPTHMGIVGERAGGHVMVYHAFTNSFSDIYGNRGTMLQGIDGNPDSTLAGIWHMTSGHGKGHWSKFTVYRGVTSTGSIEIEKKSARDDISAGNESYSLAGAVYGVYATAESAESGSEPVATLTTDEAGHAAADRIKHGSYFVKEISPAPGYALDPTVYPVTVEGGKVSTLGVAEEPQTYPVGLWLSKVDRETGEGKPLGGSTLAKAQFSFTFYGGQFETEDEAEKASAAGVAKRTWTMQTDEAGKIDFSRADAQFELHDAVGNVTETAPYLVSGDAFYTSASGKIALPLGTLFIRETAAPVGYLPDDAPQRVVHLASSGTAPEIETYEAARVSDQVIRGDLSLVKADEETMARLAHIPFALTSKTTGETHVIVTDRNGMADTSASWNAHTQDTNANDALAEGDAPRDGATQPNPIGNAGTWFNGRSDVATQADDALGALPFDTYTITELPCANNEGKKLVSFDFAIDRDKVTISLGTVDDKAAPAIRTFLKGEGGSQTVEAGEKITLVDSVEYDGLTPGQTYTVDGALHVREAADDGSARDAGVLEGPDGKPVTATQTFTPAFAHGTVDVSFTLDASALGGKSLVAFERVTHEGSLVAEHADIADEHQTVTVEDAPEAPHDKGKPYDKTGNFLLQNGWIGFVVVIIALAAGCFGFAQLGAWRRDRKHSDRR